MKYESRFLFSLAAALLGAAAAAASPTGNWHFEKSLDLASKVNAPVPSFTDLKIDGTALVLGPDCRVNLERQPYSFDQPFQASLRAGRTEAVLSPWIAKVLQFDLQDVQDYFVADAGPERCNRFAIDILVHDDRLLAVHGNRVYAFARSAAGSTAPSTPAPAKRAEKTASAVTASLPQLRGVRLSRLPFDMARFQADCANHLPVVRDVPQATTTCAPSYFPLIATPTSSDAIGRLVATHDFVRGGAENPTGDYANPASHGLHPVYLVFPPLGDVVLVRVEDIERAQERDPIRGAWLAIKGGRVTGQLNEGCSMTAEYICQWADRKGGYQLLSDGTFKPLE
jgi:hypothetical protein